MSQEQSLTLFCCNKRFWSRAWQVKPYRLAWPDISPLIGQCCYICPLIGHWLPWLGRISLFDQNVNTQSRRTKIWSLGQFLFILDWVSQLFGKYPSQISNESMSPSLASHWLDTCLSLAGYLPLIGYQWVHLAIRLLSGQLQWSQQPLNHIFSEWWTRKKNSPS